VGVEPTHLYIESVCIADVARKRGEYGHVIQHVKALYSRIDEILDCLVVCMNHIHSCTKFPFFSHIPAYSTQGLRIILSAEKSQFMRISFLPHQSWISHLYCRTEWSRKEIWIGQAGMKKVVLNIILIVWGNPRSMVFSALKDWLLRNRGLQCIEGLVALHWRIGCFAINLLRVWSSMHWRV
jgi:hypothetical protein